MKNEFALAVENSTASFISKDNLICGNAVDEIAESLQVDGKRVLLCFDSGWFAVGKSLKDRLKEEHDLVCFSLEETIYFEEKVVKLLNGVKNISQIIVIGSEPMALFVSRYFDGLNTKVIYLPLDFEFSDFLLNSLKNGATNQLVLDEGLLSNCLKNKLADAVRCVFSKRILFIEMCANETIEGLIDKNEGKNQLNKGIKLVDEYLKTRDITTLILAVVLVTVGEFLSGVGNIVSSASEILSKIQNFSLKGEREYLFYKMALRAYLLYFSNDTSCALLPPGLVVEEIELQKIFPFLPKKHQTVAPFCAFDIKKAEEYKQIILKDGKIIDLIKTQIANLDENAKLLKKEYGGRKYSVEHYSLKQRAKALSLAPYITSEFSIFHLLFASGLTQYFE